jgi:malonate-semialdehyde dehydrogenase (acetylating) / methylmalonate-semialdehyde dehydrogenase
VDQRTTAPDKPASLTRVLSNYIGGSWRTASGTDSLPTSNPATGEVLAHVPESGSSDVAAAVQAALDAASEWRALSPLKRARALLALRQQLDARQDELAHLVTQNMGKTLADARGEVMRGIESVEHACAITTQGKGQNLEGVASDVDVELWHQPVGVVAAITPFNFPAMIPLWFLPYAIACGNTFILKPSERDPLASQRLIELIDAVDAIPSGVVNLVHGSRDTVNALLEHPKIDAISFVGSAKTAQHVYGVASQQGKRVQALGGAKNAMVVMPDADPDLTTHPIIGSAFGAAGQRCLAGSVAVLVGSEDEQNRARDRIVSASAALKTGDGADSATDVCPLIGPEARLRVEGEIERAVDQGARLELDGRIGGGNAGAELRPTIIEPADPETAIAREEIFGPVLTLVRQPDLEAAIEWINNSRYGNATSIFTSLGRTAREFRYSIQAGMVGVNVGVAAPVAWFPFSGWKDSFDGDLHANGDDAFEFYTRKKVVTTRWR